MKNWRDGECDVSPPFVHRDLRLRITRLRMGDEAIVIIPGPEIVIPGNPKLLLKEMLK